MDELADTQIKLKGVEADLVDEKEERKKENEAAEQQQMVLNNQIAEMENDKLETAKKHTAEIDAITEEHKQVIAQKQEEIRLADAAGYKRGIDEMLAKQQGGEVADDKISEEVNPFMVQKKDAGPPEMNELDMMAVSQQKKILTLSASRLHASTVSLECYSSLLAQIEVLVREVSLLSGRTKKKQLGFECKAHEKAICWLTFYPVLVNLKN